LESVEIDATGESASVEPDFMLSGFLFAIYKHGNLLTMGIEKGKSSIAPSGQTITNHRGRMERMRVLLKQRDVRR
jgi:hypothetical protein